MNAAGDARSPVDHGRTVLLINARARLGRQAEEAVVAALGRHGLALDRVVRIRRPARLGTAVEALIRQGVGRLIIGGGDGTLGAAAAHLASSGVWLGIIPLGTANDFARTLGIPRPLAAAAEVAAGSHVRAIDLATANGAHFLNVASIGLSVAATMALSLRLKRWLGPTAYALAGARAFLKHPTFRARLSSPAGASEMHVHQVVVGNGTFYGGGVLVSEGSTLDDACLTVYTLGARSRWQLLRTVAMLRLRIPIERPGDVFLRAPSVRVETWPDSLRVNLDGEIRTRTPVTFCVEPGALLVLTPDVDVPLRPTIKGT